jgi:3alpha(or 20beta)-hydroxysteroid dehydrogenase
MGQMDGKVALVTGAARGQGAAEARLLAAHGAAVILTDIFDEAGVEVAGSIGDAARFVHQDVSSRADWDVAVAAAQETFGHLDVLVNNAGRYTVAPIESMALDDYLATVQVNQVGCFLGMQTVIPAMRAAGGGAIVNISSVNGMIGVAGTSAYTATKFAIRGMTRCAAAELGPAGIRVNLVCPGSIETPMLKVNPDMDLDALCAGLPIPRVGQPGEVADMVMFLASDRSAYVTGAEFVIDGGLLAALSLPAPTAGE